jgi:hypothetical protein
MSDPAIGVYSTVVVDYETAWGTAKGAPTGFQIGVNSCSLTPAQTFIDNPTITGDLNQRDPALGPISASGSLVRVADAISFPWFTKLLCGNLSTTGGPNYVHSSIVSTNLPLSAVVETKFNIGGTLKYSTGSGTRINKFSIPIDPTGFLITSYDLMAKNVIIGDTAYNAASAAVYAYAVVTNNGSAPSDGDTVKVGAKTYRFKTSLLTANDVLIGSTGSGADAMENLLAAVNDSGDEGVLYGTATTVNADFAAGTLTPTSVTFTAKVAGTAANTSDSTTPIGTTNSFPGTTFATSGHPGVAVDNPAVNWTANSPMDQLQLASAAVNIAGAPVGYISKGSLAVDCSLGGNDYRVGASGARGSLVPGRYKVSGSLDLALDSVGVLTLITAGTPVSLDFKWASDANTYFKATVPRAFIQKTGPTLTGDGAVMVTAAFQGAFDAATGSTVKFESANGNAGSVYV